MPSRSGQPDLLRTERLLLRRARTDDVSALHAIMRQPLAMRYWSTLPHPDVAATHAFIDSMMNPPHEGSDDFIIECEGRVIGKLGCWRLPDVGYILDPAEWGRGYASEALAAFITHRRGQGGTELTADTDPRNTASISLLERHGFVETGSAARTWLVGDEWCDSIYWRLEL